MQNLCQLKVICKFISRHEQWTACKTCRLSVSGDFLIISVGSCWGPPWLTNSNICLFMTLCLYSDFLLYCIHKVEHKNCMRARFIVFFYLWNKAIIILRCHVLRHHFSYLRIHVQNGNGVLKGLVPCLKCMKLVYWVLQASLDLYYYLK